MCGEIVGSGWTSSVKPHCRGPAGTPGCWGPDVTGVTLTESAVQGGGMQIVGPYSRVLLMLLTCSPPQCSPLPTCCVWGQEPAFGRRRVNRSALSCEGRKCCRNHCSLSGLKRKLCKERRPGARGFPSLPRHLPSLWGFHCSGRLLQLRGLLWAHRPGASHKTPAIATVKGWTWPWECQGACSPRGCLRWGVCVAWRGSG